MTVPPLGAGHPVTDPNVPDEKLLADFLSGEEAMFALLVHRYEQPLYAFILRFTGDSEDAKDLFQETFIRVFRYASAFRGESSVKTWIYSIATNACWSHLRGEQKRKKRCTGSARNGRLPSEKRHKTALRAGV